MLVGGNAFYHFDFAIPQSIQYAWNLVKVADVQVLGGIDGEGFVEMPLCAIGEGDRQRNEDFPDFRGIVIPVDCDGSIAVLSAIVTPSVQVGFPVLDDAFDPDGERPGVFGGINL